MNETCLALTMNQAVCRSHQSVPQTNVPESQKQPKWCLLLNFLSHSVKKNKNKPKKEKAFWQTLVWRRLSPFWVPAPITCCQSRALRWRWAKTSQQRRSREPSCCGTATSASGGGRVGGGPKQTNKNQPKQQRRRLAASESDGAERIKLRRPHQVGFGSVPAGVGLPKTQTSVSVHDAKLHEISRQPDIRAAGGKTTSQPVSFLIRPAEHDEIKSSKYIHSVCACVHKVISCRVFSHFNKKLNTVTYFDASVGK